MQIRHAPVIVSFSGIDGAGKSTQITALTAHLEGLGLRIRLLTFWDDVVVLSRVRELTSQKAFRGDAGVGTPDKPVERRDKDVTWWPVVMIRFFLYCADGLNLWRVVSRNDEQNADVVIFDRYIYDELANLPLGCKLTRVFVRALLKLIPRPDIAFLVDADPAAARARKPEYPLEFLRLNREAYLALNRLTQQLFMVGPADVEQCKAIIRKAVLARMSRVESKLPALVFTK
jgi:thymidylate kinase